MKVAELLYEQEQLDEINLKQAVAAGLIGAATMMPMKTDTSADPAPEHSQQVRQEFKKEQQQETLARGIARRYRIAFDDAIKIVKSAAAHAKPSFPRTEDILAVIGIESSFDKTKKSALRRDPAVGLMQVRPGIWKVPTKNLRTIDGQIQIGANILSQYFNKLQDVDGALTAYNVGITNYRRGMDNPGYVDKFHAEKQAIKQLQAVPQK
jgi:soluble lytic murein transglycosylase-like protein